MEDQINPAEIVIHSLGDFFNTHHDKLVCTVSKDGIPNVAIMGTPRLIDENIEFEISDPVSVTLKNMKESKHLVFIAYKSGIRARDYFGARIQAEIIDLQTSGQKLESKREQIRARHGDEKAADLLATVTCKVIHVRPIVDRGQPWNEPPFKV